MDSVGLDPHCSVKRSQKYSALKLLSGHYIDIILQSLNLYASAQLVTRTVQVSSGRNSPLLLSRIFDVLFTGIRNSCCRTDIHNTSIELVIRDSTYLGKYSPASYFFNPVGFNSCFIRGYNKTNKINE